MSEFKFSCPACGQSILADTAHGGMDINCPACQALIVVPKESAGPAAAPAPIAAPPPFTGYNAAPAVPQTSGLAIASLVCSLSSVATCVGWLPGIICGHLAKSRLRRNPALKGHGLATAGLAIGYLILTLEAGVAAVKLWSFSHAVKQGVENFQQALATNNFIITTTNAMAAANARPAAEAITNALAAAGWTTNLSLMSFPGQPASGQIHGLDFALKTATFKSVNLKLNGENGLALEVLGLGKSPAGHTYEVASADDAANPRIQITWNDGTVSQSVKFSTGYALKLEFAEAVGRKLSGKIYVCLPDDAKSYVAGTFQVRLPKPK